MMDDEYNVISTGLVDEDLDGLQYPDDNEDVGLAVVSRNEDGETDGGNNENSERMERAINALEESGYGRRKRQLEDIEDVYDDYGNRSHPVDWFMRMPIRSEDIDDLNKINAAKRRALEKLENQINEAIAKDEVISKEQHGGEENEEAINCVEDLCINEIKTRYQRKKEIMKYPPSDGSSWIGISDSAIGTRFYIRSFKEEKNYEESLIETISRKITGSNFGYRSFQNVMKEADEMRVRKIEELRKKKEDQFNLLMNSESVDIEPSQPGSSLWVDKYEAKNFADLLSDNAVNRNILTWLKMWDECVFKRNIDNLLNSLNEKEKEVLQMDNGKIRRPHFKMILISGPAGLGKTTLAKIVARQAGYTSIDVNASDARTVADLNRVLEGAVKTSRTLDRDQRPACLILDEIDGSPIDTIRHLVRCLQAVGKKAIRRPIIGICNNLFTPALRELRSVAWCVQLSSTKQESLSKRLEYICDRENIRCDSRTLRKLCEMCANDMRHTINTLQWVAIASKKHNRTIGMKLIQEVMEKEKSGAASIFEHWSAILELSKHLNGKGGIKTVGDRVAAIQKISAEHGGEDRFVVGLHANYLLPLPIGQIRKASLWFLFYDNIQKIIHSLQNWTVQKYAFVFFVALHLNVATHSRAHINYPQLEQNYHQKLKESEEILNNVRIGGPMAKRSHRTELLKDILPYLVGIVQPLIKPMNEHLYTQREHAMLNAVVNIMIDYGLTYTALMVKDQVNWLFSPSIDILTMFPISEDKRRNCLANATRQLIAHKITLLRINSVENSDNNRVATNTEKIKQLIEEGKNKEKNRMKRLSAGALKRIRHKQLSEVTFTHQDGDSSAVKKKITMQQLDNLIFGNL